MIATLFGVTLLISMVFQNCGETQALQSELPSLASLCGASQKSQLKSSQKAPLQPGSISLLFDPSCLNEEEEIKVLGQSFKVSLHSPIVALSLEVDSVQLNQLLQDWPDHPCWLAIEQDALASHQSESQTSAEGDPQIPSQLQAIGFRPELWMIQNSNQRVRMAIIDSGVDYQHDDIENSLWLNSKGEVGYNFLSQTPDPFDDEGHGTHIAGIVAGKTNANTLSRGLAYGVVEIMSLKVLDQTGNGKASHIYNAVRYAIEQGAEIININVATEGESPILEAALVEAVQSGVLVVVALGNQGLELSTEKKIAPAYIAKDLNGVIGVASVNASNLQLSNFSNHSPQYGEIAAPGEINASSGGGILSTYPDQSFARMRGTSQASPLVAATAALLISYLKTHQIAYTVASIEKFLLQAGSQKQTELFSKVQEGRVLNLQHLSANLSEFHDEWLKSGQMQYFEDDVQLCASP